MKKNRLVKTKAELKLMGHQLKKLDNPYGNMQIVIWNKRTQQLDAASDPRGEGLAKIK